VFNLEQSEVLLFSRICAGFLAGKSDVAPGEPDRDSKLRVVLAPSLTAASSARHRPGFMSSPARIQGGKSRWSEEPKLGRAVYTGAPFSQRMERKHDQFHRIAVLGGIIG
jgi:hypothetical protein